VFSAVQKGLTLDPLSKPRHSVNSTAQSDIVAELSDLPKRHLRETGIDAGGPSALMRRDRASCLDTLDRLVNAAQRGITLPLTATTRSRLTVKGYVDPGAGEGDFDRKRMVDYHPQG
jgi:hypothetical protein